MKVQSRYFSASILSLVAFLGAVGCKSSEPERVFEPMPFHVAIIPVQPEAKAVVVSEDDSVEISLDAVQVNNALKDALQRQCFTRASMMPLPRNPQDPNAGAHYVAEARRLKADLILECQKVQYEPRVQSETKNLLTSLPLFLIGGPFVYFIDDRGYEVEAQVVANLHDVNVLANSLEDRAIPAAFVSDIAPRELERVEATAGEIELDFRDRAKDSPTKWYASSLIIPTGFLADSNEAAARAVVEGTIESITANLAASINNKRSDILYPDAGATRLRLDPSRCELKNEPNRLVFRGIVYLKRDANVRDLESVAILCGNEPVEGQFLEIVSGAAGEGGVERSTNPLFDGYTGYTLRVDVPADAAADLDYVQVRVTLKSATANPRSWTFKVP